MLGISALTLLSGCDWFDGPVKVEKLRPGAERAMSPSESLPPPPTGVSYGVAIAPVDETRNAPQIGSIVAASGGQKAQLEKMEKEASARDAEERVARDKADKERAERDKLADTNAGPAKAPVTGDVPGEAPTQPVAAPRAPVVAAPVSPPTDVPPAAGSPASPATPPAGPNAETKPAGT